MKMAEGHTLISKETYDHIKQHIDKVAVNILAGEVEKTTYLSNNGYVRFNLKNKYILVHHVIGYFIFGERMIGKQINHLDGNKQNNKPSNLELTTPSENLRHAFATGLKKAKKGEELKVSKITEKDVVEIRKLRNEGKTLKAIGDKYGLAFQQISKICNGQRWGHVPFDFDEDLASMDFNKYQELTQRTVDKSLSDFDEVANYALGLVSEAGEVSDHIKKELYHGHEVDNEFVKDELSDVLWYMANLARKYNLTLKDIAVHNIEKLKNRYPDGFDKNRSINRKES